VAVLTVCQIWKKEAIPPPQPPSQEDEDSFLSAEEYVSSGFLRLEGPHF
jgi:hypothetical protein